MNDFQMHNKGGPSKTRGPKGKGNPGYLKQQRRARGEHQAYQYVNPTPQRRSKAVRPHSRRLDPRHGVALVMMLFVQHGTGVAAEIDFRTGGRVEFGSNGSSKQGRQSPKKEGKPAEHYPKNTDVTAFERAMSVFSSKEKNIVNQKRYPTVSRALNPSDREEDARGDRFGYRPSNNRVADTDAGTLLYRMRRDVEPANLDSGADDEIKVTDEPQNFIEQTVGNVLTRPELITHKLLDAGLDPFRNVTVRRSEAAPWMLKTVPLLQAVLEGVHNAAWVGGPYSLERIKSSIPEANDLFYGYIHSHIAEASRDLKGLVLTKLYLNGVDVENAATVHRVRFVNNAFHERAGGTHSSPYGYLLEVEAAEGKRFFAVVPRHKEEIVWSLPADAAERSDWVKANRHLFTSDPFERFLQVESVDTYDDVVEAVETMSKSIMEAVLKPLKISYYQETVLEESGKWLAWVIPFAEAVSAIKRGEFWEAFVYAAVDLYLLGAQNGVSGLAKAVKATTRWLGKTTVRRMGKFTIRQMIATGKKDAVRKALKAAVETKLDDVSKQAVQKSGGPIEKLSNSAVRNAAEDAVEQVIEEAVNPVARGVSRTLASQIDELNDLIIKDKTLAKYIARPKEQCEAALADVILTLQNAGYTTEVRAMEVWSNGLSAIIPKERLHYQPITHFIVLARKQSGKVAVDVTAGQFWRQGINGPIIASLDEWRDIFVRAFPNYYIRYQDVSSSAVALRIVHPGSIKKITDGIEGGFDVLNNPSWMIDLPKEIKKVARRKQINKLPKWRTQHVSRKNRNGRALREGVHGHDEGEDHQHEAHRTERHQHGHGHGHGRHQYRRRR